MHVLALIVSLFAAAPAVTNVRIEAHWRGLGDPIDENFTINVAEHREAVARLVRAMNAEPVKRARAMELIAEPRWLATAADERTRGLCSAGARKLLADDFRDPKRAAAALDRTFNTTSLDDYPSLTVTIRFADGKTSSASSRSPHALMLPWQTERGDTWNPELPRAVAALMPARSTRRAALLDATLAKTIADEIHESIVDRFEDAEQRCIHKDFVAAIEKRFAIERAYRGTPSQFSAYLRGSDLPANLIIDAHIEHLAGFLAKIDGDIAVARPFAIAHPETTFDLVYDDTTMPADDVRLVDHSSPVRVWTLPRSPR